jgi:hypothetical protein
MWHLTKTRLINILSITCWNFVCVFENQRVKIFMIFPVSIYPSKCHLDLVTFLPWQLMVTRMQV